MKKPEHHFANGGKPIKERPILFSAQMVRAILNGKKTQTRRVIKSKDICGNYITNVRKIEGNCWRFEGSEPINEIYGNNKTFIDANFPYGDIGDQLWVRETWQGPLLEDSETNAAIDWYGPSHIEKYKSPAHCVYRADEVPTPEYVDIEDNLRQGWKPSIHMPRWASRILLEITNVRVERLQDISEEDAVAEGIPIDYLEHVHGPGGYRDLWESINGPGSWDANPWVWVIEFKVIS